MRTTVIFVIPFALHADVQPYVDHDQKLNKVITFQYSVVTKVSTETEKYYNTTTKLN